jgi:hypothetical protein
MTSKQLSHKSEQYFIQKFTKQLIRLWQSLSLDEISQSNETLNYLIFKETLVRMGFLNENQLNSYEKTYNAQKNSEADKNIVFEMWRNLGGEARNHVTLNNLRIFLLAIMGTYVEPGLNKDE